MANIYKGWHLYMLQGKYEIKYNNIYIFINLVFIFYHKYFQVSADFLKKMKPFRIH